jgi:hypothetical protein
MPDLPLGNFSFYAGMDPGHKGAIAVINATGTSARVWRMPLKEDGVGIDLSGLREIFRKLASFPNVTAGIEWPVPWPGAFANVCRDAEIFGQQKALLEAFAFLHNLDYHRVPPQLWKSRLGLDGKQIQGASERAANLWGMFYPEFSQLVRGPRGGLLDGPLDALLIAHFLRTRNGEGMKSIADKFGKDSVEAFAFMLGGARRKKKFGRRLA